MRLTTRIERSNAAMRAPKPQSTSSRWCIPSQSVSFSVPKPDDLEPEGILLLSPIRDLYPHSCPADTHCVYQSEVGVLGFQNLDDRR